MSEENKALVRRVFEEVWNQHNVKAMDGLFAPDHLGHDPNTGDHVGRDAEKAAFQGYMTAFPDIHFEVEDQLAEGDLVATRWTASGTHRGDLVGIAPTGKYVTGTGIVISRIRSGQLVESWVNYDMLGLLQQIGVVPAMTPAGTGG